MTVILTFFAEYPDAFFGNPGISFDTGTFRSRKEQFMDIGRRSFIKTTAGAALALGLPLGVISSALAKPRARIREFHFSASKAKINLGKGPDFSSPWRLKNETLLS